MTHHPAQPVGPRPSRRAVARGMAWSVPVVATSAVAPAIAASQCTASLEWTTATVTRVSNEAFAWQWDDVFGPGVDVRLRVTSAYVSGPGGITSSNLLWAQATPGWPTGSTWGGVPGATAAMQMSASVTSGSSGRVRVNYQFAVEIMTPSGWQSHSASDLGFSIVDIEGMYSAATNSGAETIWLGDGGWISEIVDTTYLMGTGTIIDPWTKTEDGQPNTIDNYLDNGTVNVSSSVPRDQWTLGFGVESRQSTGGTITSNVWLAAPSFTVQNPTCV